MKKLATSLSTWSFRASGSTNLNDVHKLIIYVIRLHLLTNEIGHSAQNCDYRSDLAVPSEKCGNPRSINTSGFSAAIDIWRVISISIIPIKPS